MLNIEKYKDEIIEEYRNLLKNFDIDGNGNRINKAIQTVAFKHCGKVLRGTSITFRWLFEEYEEPVLNSVEREYLSAVIKPYKNKVTFIAKSKDTYEAKYFISIVVNGNYGREAIHLPWFKENTMYKNMEIGKHYTLKELGL